MSTNRTCINCQEPVTQNYCGQCGQKTEIKPITWRGLFLELTTTWLGTDNRMYRTLKGLTLNPKKVVEEFLDGNRVKYLGPLSYLIFMSFIYVLSFQVLGFTPREMFGEVGTVFDPMAVNQSKEQQEFMEMYVTVLSENMRMLTGMMIPFLALSLNIFYKKRNYLQHFLMASYLASHLVWLNLFNNISYAVLGRMYFMLAFLLSMAYYMWSIGSLNPQKSKVWTYTKGVFVWVGAYVLFMLAMIVISAVVVGYRLSQG